MAPISALLQRFCMLIFVHLTTGTGHFWRTICDVADKEGERGQKALDELIAAIPAIATMEENDARPLVERIADGYQEPPEGDPLSPPVGLSTDALGRLMIAHDRLVAGSRLPVGALVQAGSPAPPAVVELATRLTSAQWNAEGEQARKVIEAVLALNGSPLGSSKVSAPREEIFAELNVPAGANLLDFAAELIASGKLPDVLGKTRTVKIPEAPPPTQDDDGARFLLPEEIPELSRQEYWALAAAGGLENRSGDLDGAIGFVLLRIQSETKTKFASDMRSKIPGWVLRAKGERARALVKQILAHPSNAPHGLQAFEPEPAPSPPPPLSDLLRAVDALRVYFKVEIGPDLDVDSDWLVCLTPPVGPVLRYSSAFLEQALLKAIDGSRQQLEQQSQRITRALDAIRGAQ